MTAGIVIIVIVAIIAIWFIATYNKIVKLNNRVDNAWAQIDVQLQRRYELVPRLVEVVRAYAEHETNTLTKVVDARKLAMEANNIESRKKAEGNLSGALHTLLALAEAYPELKANLNFSQLQTQLAETEDKISYMRQSYNDTVMRFNTAIESFPANIVANLFKFTKCNPFDAASGADMAPQVKFGD